MITKVKIPFHEFSKLVPLAKNKSSDTFVTIEPGPGPDELVFHQNWSEVGESIAVTTIGHDWVIQGNITVARVPFLDASNRPPASFIEIESASPDKLIVRNGDQAVEVPGFAPVWLKLDEPGPFSVTMDAAAIRAMLGPQWGDSQDDWDRYGVPDVDVEFLPSTGWRPPLLVSATSYRRRYFGRTLVLPVGPFARFQRRIDADMVAEVRQFNSGQERLRLTFENNWLTLSGSHGTMSLPAPEADDARVHRGKLLAGSFPAKQVVAGMRKLSNEALSHAFAKSWPKSTGIRLSWQREHSLALSFDSGIEVHLVCGEWRFPGSVVFDLADLGRVLSSFGDAEVQMLVPIGDGTEPPWIEFSDRNTGRHEEAVEAIRT